MKEVSGSDTPCYVHLGRQMNGVLYRPAQGYGPTGVLVMHSDADYLNFTAGKNLASRGILTLCANVQHPETPLENRLPDVQLGMEFLKAQPGIRNVVLLGHSGGATLMSCYQAIAENGPSIFRDQGRIVKMGEVPELMPADGIMLIDSNFGNGVMTLVSLDPGVSDETTGRNQDNGYSTLSPASGYQAEGNTAYTPAFRKRYYAAQAQRQEKLIQSALDRLKALNAGTGRYLDDEPFLVPGGSQIAPNNRLFPQDLHILAHTKGAYDLLHADGTVTHQVIPSVRSAREGIDFTPLYGPGAMKTTVRTYLSSNCVRTTEGYGVMEDGIEGIDYDSAFCCPPGNVKHIHAPMLIMGMTGGYECIASEIIYQNAASQEKTIAFVEGGTHMLGTARESESYPGQFGDAAKTLFDHIALWLAQHFQ